MTENAIQSNLWAFIFAQHYVLQILGLLMFAAFGFGLYNFIKNYLYLKKNIETDSNFIESIVDDLHDAKIESALELCQRSQFAEARIIQKALIRMGKPIKDIIMALQQQEYCERIKLKQHMLWVSFGAWACFILAIITGLIAYGISVTPGNASIPQTTYAPIAGVLALGLALALVLLALHHLLHAMFNKTILVINLHLNYFCDAINKTY
jgi:biopolymer transport protein ExbB